MTLAGRPSAPLLATLAFIALAALLRLYGLADNPPGVFRDELEKGYTALELWRTGRHGVLGAEGVAVSGFFPLFIEVFQGHDRTSATYQYLAAPIVGLFGLGVFQTRLPAALCGIAFVALFALHAGRHFDRRAAVIATGTAALLPLGIIFSRWAQQGITLPLLTLGGFVLLDSALVAREERRRALACLGALCLGAACWAYDPARLVVPLLAAAWAWCRWHDGVSTMRKTFVPAAAVLAMFWVPLLVYTLTAGSARLDRVGIFAEAGLVSGLARAAANYAAHFHPAFLFWSGDANGRHGLPGAGVVGLGSALLMLAGVAAALTHAARGGRERRYAALFPLLWLLAAPAAAALTTEGIPHALRSILIIPAVCLLAAQGAAFLLDRWSWRPLPAVLFALLLVDGWQAARGLAKLRESPAGVWESGRVEALEWALEASPRPYVAIEIPYAPYLILFTEALDPSLYHEVGLEAARSRVAPQQAALSMAEGEVMVGMPTAGMPPGLHEEAVARFVAGAGGLLVLPPLRRAEGSPR